ncbi:protein cereblon isoform X2 [Episyrphus balteatus]|uniref:protein cereblon isoform X2 n=1 Tax=Episyrphus balteatus TaxID=286459 RepID=UPI0024868A86|nr:protein cereblon isoform X2 [Episyrphus balteatus]
MDIDSEDPNLGRENVEEVAESPAVVATGSRQVIDTEDSPESDDSAESQSAVLRRVSRVNSEPNNPTETSSDDDGEPMRSYIIAPWEPDDEAVHMSDSEIEIEIERDERDLTELLTLERFSNTDEDASDPDAEQRARDNEIRFDTNLPAEHSYLGTNMNRVSGVEYLDTGRIHRIMLFMHQHIIFPGEVLPFMIPGFIIEADIDSDNGLLFGVAFGHVRCPKTQAMYGVTCQIYEKGTDERGHTLIKSRALQRFITTNDTRREHLEYITSGLQLKTFGYIKILPEISLPDPLASINIGSMNRFRDIPGLAGYLSDFRATTTIWPKHVFNQFTISSIIEKVLKSLETNKVQSMPTDPTRLSFWLSRNAHISEDQLSKIFMTDCTNVRMRMIADSFSDGSVFVCRVCRNPIAHCRELFAMSKHGVQSQYCNSSGYIHETNTVYKVFPNAITFSGEPSSEFSWFPGYEWHIIVCKMCNRHIGWQFRANGDNLSPVLFYGITGASVKVSKKNETRTLRNNLFSNLFQLIDL